MNDIFITSKRHLQSLKMDFRMAKGMNNGLTIQYGNKHKNLKLGYKTE